MRYFKVTVNGDWHPITLPEFFDYLGAGYEYSVLSDSIIGAVYAYLVDYEKD